VTPQGDPARRYKIIIAYDGSRLVGWQRQAEGESVQGLLEAACSRLEGRPVTVHGAGRTDAGVHALGQVASVSLTRGHPPDVLVRAVNAQLPPDVRVLAVHEVPADFHARFSARAKTYRYLLRHAGVASPFERAYVWHLADALDIDAMRRAAAVLVGMHDFAAFCSRGSRVSHTTRTLVRSEILERPMTLHALDSASVGDLLAYEVEGDGFLRHMVRAIVGTLVEIGRGRPAGSMERLLAGADRAAAGPTAPAHGLYLVRVDYD
jgi:tRNA pseudouridine38-40 synthase